MHREVVTDLARPYTTKKHKDVVLQADSKLDKTTIGRGNSIDKVTVG